MKRTSSIMLAAVLSLTMTAATCTKSDLLSNAGDVLSSLQSAQPLINQLIPNAAPRIAQAISIATKLRDAIAANQTSNGAALLVQLIPAFQSIVNQDINGLTAAQKTTILAALAVADIGLHFLVSRLQKNMPPSAGPGASAVSAFDREETWGLKYKTKK